MSEIIRVLVWNEWLHQNNKPKVVAAYPDGLHVELQRGLERHLGDAATVDTTTFDADDEHGLSEDKLRQTDVLLWWGHIAHAKVRDDVAERVVQRVREGMGLIVLHSGQHAKPFLKLLGTAGHIRWRNSGVPERLSVIAPGHPITEGLASDHFELETTEEFGEPFDVPTPDELIFISGFPSGQVFRSGCVWNRGAGKVFYFRPGHETYPIYRDANVQRVLANAVRYLVPRHGTVGFRDTSPNMNDG